MSAEKYVSFSLRFLLYLQELTFQKFPAMMWTLILMLKGLPELSKVSLYIPVTGKE